MAPAPLIQTDKGVSDRMRRQRSRDTQPEVALRRSLFAMGKRYRVHYPVPGMPRRAIDIAFTRAKIAVFVDGCFWHSCPDHATRPASNANWWATKLERNKQRDSETDEHLRSLGWTVVRVWEHEPVADAATRVSELQDRLSVTAVD